jgi:hypothetical protein
VGVDSLSQCFQPFWVCGTLNVFKKVGGTPTSQANLTLSNLIVSNDKKQIKLAIFIFRIVNISRISPKIEEKLKNDTFSQYLMGI